MQNPESADNLIQPECLSTEELKYLLLQRGVLPQHLPQDRGGIVDLYNRLILPLPQRETIKSCRLSKKLLLSRKSMEEVSGSHTLTNNSTHSRSSNERNFSINTITTINYNKSGNTSNKRPHYSTTSTSPSSAASLAKKSRQAITWP